MKHQDTESRGTTRQHEAAARGSGTTRRHGALASQKTALEIAQIKPLSRQKHGYRAKYTAIAPEMSILRHYLRGTSYDPSLKSPEKGPKRLVFDLHSDGHSVQERIAPYALWNILPI
ncbi:hypothetical protein HQ496_01690 [bacterium]|nr:hypothetical protein [bacterium]